MQNSNELEATFNSIYRERLWGNGISSSGDGSNPEVALPYVQFVHELIKRLGIQSVVDIGHGDWKMWPKDAFEGVKYIGLDASSDVSAHVQLELGNESRTFIHADAISAELPDADLVLCKDVLQHLSSENVEALVQRLTKFQYIVLVNDIVVRPRNIFQVAKISRYKIAPRARVNLLRRGKNPFQQLLWKQNSDINDGQYRCLNLLELPWNLDAWNLRLIEEFRFPSSKSEWIGTEKQVLVLASNYH